MNQEPKIKFGTDGWRGVIGREFTFDNVRLAAHATAKTFESKSGSKPKVFIGYDHRFLAEKFAEEVCRVLSCYRFEPQVLSEAVSSPFVSFVTHRNQSPFGVMMTASHNPAEYLGFKVKGSFGGSIPQSAANEIENHLKEVLSNPGALPQISPMGKIVSHDFNRELEAYIAYVKKHIDVALLRSSRLPVTFDVLYGPGGKIAGRFFKAIQSKLNLEIIHNHRDALFGGLHPEPIEEYLGDLKKAVKQSKSIAGFALDGDADRLGMIDEKSRYLSTPQVFSLLLYYLAAQKKVKGKVVQAVSLGYVSERIAADFNLPLEETPVGFKYVAERIVKEDVVLGGEESGGYAFSRTTPRAPRGELLPERDGLLSALLFLEMILVNKKSVSQLLKDLDKRYGPACFLRKDIPLPRPVDKSEFVGKMQSQFPSKWMGLKIKEMRTLDGLKIVMEDGSWILMRPSGTEPLLRTYGEFPSRSLTEKALEQLLKLVSEVI